MAERSTDRREAASWICSLRLGGQIWLCRLRRIHRGRNRLKAVIAARVNLPEAG